MAEEDDVLETETPKEGEEGETSEGGSFVSKITNQISQLKTKISEIEFTKELIIKIVIGFLIVLLIALAAYFFMPKEEAVEEASAEAEAVEATTEGAEGDSTTASSLSEISGELTEPTADLSGAIEGDVVIAEDEVLDSSVAEATVILEDASAAESANLQAQPKPEAPDLEMFKLREQALMLEEENRRLKRSVTRLQRQTENNQSEPRQAKSPTTREAQEDTGQNPTWGDFSPLHQGP